MGRIGGEVEGSEFNREVIAAISEAAFNQSRLLAWDLEAFSRSRDPSGSSRNSVLCFNFKPAGSGSKIAHSTQSDVMHSLAKKMALLFLIEDLHVR